LVLTLNSPAVINFTHYTHGTGQVRSSLHTQNTWQLREFKTDINSQGEVVFVSDTVKSNPLARLFANVGEYDPEFPLLAGKSVGTNTKFP
jgi:hypothetical protein